MNPMQFDASVHVYQQEVPVFKDWPVAFPIGLQHLVLYFTDSLQTELSRSGLASQWVPLSCVDT